MKIVEWLEIIDYKVYNSSNYNWSCFGENVYVYVWQLLNNRDSIDYESIVCFDTKSREVYCIEIYDENTEIYYRWVRDEYRVEYDNECISRRVCQAPRNYSIEFKYLESDILDALRSIYNNHSR